MLLDLDYHRMSQRSTPTHLINMSNPLYPKREEEKTQLLITGREAHLLSELRLVRFGEIKVFKADNIIVRVESSASKLIQEDEGLSYAKKEKEQHES